MTGWNTKVIDAKTTRQIIRDRGCTCDPAKRGERQICKEHTPWAWKQAQLQAGAR